ncbi:MAG: hydroxyquinol 1,2-dioxygenase [Pseudonocardiales bacterium]|jgi:hydroxyquinol 1,2-dioxygenase|nr:hydroxyquinol 1,2-dioxygenase [Pseudonocardiales bacterium]MDT4970665.1 hydroxyquinol 1,2-dioxygenase [Pseudonocardiales bacterium]
MTSPVSDSDTTEQDRRERQLVDAVIASFADTPNERLRTVLTAMVEHLHALIREVRLTGQEWEQAIAFLTHAGHITDDKRQEFILLSDVLGASMQTIIVNDDPTGRSTEATVVGPFFVENSTRVQLGADISGGASGEPCWVEGVVSDIDGRPLGGARIEVWEADDDGYYDVQYRDERSAARGHLYTDDDGRYRFWALTPTRYPIPSDGPVGGLLAATNRSPMRAPHLHFMVSHEGMRTVTTHVFVAGEDLGSDSVFGIRDSLIVDFSRSSGEEPTPDGRVIQGTSWTRARFDIVLAPQPVPRSTRSPA